VDAGVRAWLSLREQLPYQSVSAHSWNVAILCYVRVPRKGFLRWAAQHPRLGAPLWGVALGLALGLLVGVALRSWTAPIGAVVGGAFIGCWQVNAMHRALNGDHNTPYA
jgi:hypothetical protein